LEIHYRGFVAEVFFSPEAGSFCGEVLNSSDVIAFQASTLEEARQALQESVEQYLQYQSKYRLQASEMR